MIFFGGGAAAAYLSAMSSSYRYQSARTSHGHALRVALQKTHLQHPGWSGSSEGSPPREAGWESFECYHLCEGCGYLASAVEAPCPGCDGRAWIDLRSQVAADTLRQLESAARQASPGDIGKWSVIAGLGLGAAATATAALAVGPVVLGPAVALGGAIWAASTGVSMLVINRVWRALRLRRPPRRPIRWRLPLPQGEGDAAPVATGPAEPRGDLLAAPVSGRPCIAYELTVLFDAPGDKRPPMWLLEEERSIPFTLGGVEVPADGATIDLPRSPVARSDGPVDAPQVARLLRQRGLFTSEGDYLLHESLVEPGARYTLVKPARPADAVPVIRPG